ncbi:hypothetical protein V9K67_22305 [Paraflavisolibacter sp. H34]|uniref:hypothetical protein n=1 Tax=Huijunlia imazamoxiresistens TaxID=3127457 RepID=UPI003015E024
MQTTPNVTFRPSSENITYEQFGKEAAKDASSNSVQLKNYLEILYLRIVERASEDKGTIAKKIGQLKDNLLAENNTKKRLDAENKTHRSEIEDLKGQIQKIEAGKGIPDYLSFVIASFITVLLSFYLWTFYAASGYAALNGVKPGTHGFAGVFSALSAAFNKGGFVVVLTVLFPTIFLSLGFLIHDAIEKKKYFFIAVLLLFTFCLDAIIGYKISENIHLNAYNAGATETTWQFNMVYADLNFYLVLASGFVCYVMWGVLLNYTLNKWKEIQPDSMVVRVKNKIKELSILIDENEGKLLICDNNIKRVSKDIEDFENGKVIVNVPALKANVGEFMGGWSAFTNMMYNESAETLLSEADGKKEEWLAIKISQLESLN